MKVLQPYDREKARDYARKWALSRNPAYHDYEEWGGNCTNFISQCVHAGKIPFDNQPPYIWYWYSDYSRTPSWTSAEAFYQYLINNNTSKTQNFGVYARNAEYNELEIGDIAQLVYEGKAFHTMMITEVILEDDYLIDYYESQNTYDLLDYPLSMKAGEQRYIKILGYYNW